MSAIMRSMPNGRSRAQIQAALRLAFIVELGRMRLPQDGRHLARVVRALVHLAVELMQAVRVPDVVTAQLVSRVMKKTLRNLGAEPVLGLFGRVPEGKA